MEVQLGKHLPVRNETNLQQMFLIDKTSYEGSSRFKAIELMMSGDVKHQGGQAAAGYVPYQWPGRGWVGVCWIGSHA